MVYKIGQIEVDGKKQDIWVQVRQVGYLSIMGIIGPRGANAVAAGQIIISFKEYDDRGYWSIEDIEPAKGWSHEMIRRLFDIWDKWHLKQDVPQEVIDYLQSLPKAQIPNHLIEWFR